METLSVSNKERSASRISRILLWFLRFTRYWSYGCRLQRKEFQEGLRRNWNVKGGLINVRQFLLKRWILVRDTGMAQRSPKQAATITAQLNHLCVFFSQPERSSSDGKYSLPVFSRIILSSSGYLLEREMILSKLAPDSLFLCQDGEMFASLRRSFDVPWIAQSKEHLPTAFGR